MAISNQWGTDQAIGFIGLNVYMPLTSEWPRLHPLFFHDTVQQVLCPVYPEVHLVLDSSNTQMNIQIEEVVHVFSLKAVLLAHSGFH